VIRVNRKRTDSSNNHPLNRFVHSFYSQQPESPRQEFYLAPTSFSVTQISSTS
jgi:hypothetical protein